MLQVVVDAIDPNVIVSHCASKTFDFGSVTEPELTNFSIPLKLQMGQFAAHTITVSTCLLWLYASSGAARCTLNFDSIGSQASVWPTDHDTQHGQLVNLSGLKTGTQSASHGTIPAPNKAGVLSVATIIDT